MAPGGKMLARRIFGPRDVEKDKRLNRQAARFDPPHHQAEAVRSFRPTFAPSPGRPCIDPRHVIWEARGRIATPQQLQAAGMKFPMNALRRQRPGGGWGWVTMHRPDGQPLIPFDAPRVSNLDYLDFLGYQLSPRCTHELGKFCRHCCHGSPRAIRRPKDDGWEDISWFDVPHFLRDTRGRRGSFVRREDGLPYPHRDDWRSDTYYRYPHHHRWIQPHLAMDSDSVYNDSEMSAWLSARPAMMDPRYHDTNRHHFGPRVHGQELRNTTPSTDDDESMYVHDNDEDGAAATFWEDFYSDLNYSVEE